MSLAVFASAALAGVAAVAVAVAEALAVAAEPTAQLLVQSLKGSTTYHRTSSQVVAASW